MEREGTAKSAKKGKSCQYFIICLNSIKVDKGTTEVDIRAMEKAINSNTILSVGSTPNFPYGTMDDIEQVAALGREYNITVHVDGCLGSFIIAFMRRAGYSIKPFDFTADGITSITADTHKYGFIPKGSSVILYSDKKKKYVHHQYTVNSVVARAFAVPDKKFPFGNKLFLVNETPQKVAHCFVLHNEVYKKKKANKESHRRGGRERKLGLNLK